MKTPRHLPRLACFVLLGLLGPLGLSAQAGMTMDQIAAIGQGANAVVGVTLGTGTTGTPRLYFRRHGHGDFYFVAMHASGGAGYFGILPKPAAETERVEYYIALIDARGTVVERTSPAVVPVLASAPAPALSPLQAGLATSLTVGDSVPSQRGHAVAWFRNEGVANRLDAGGNESSAQGGDNLGNAVVIGDPGPAPKEVSLPRP